jgi:hypothetical protein
MKSALQPSSEREREKGRKRGRQKERETERQKESQSRYTYLSLIKISEPFLTMSLFKGKQYWECETLKFRISIVKGFFFNLH